MLERNAPAKVNLGLGVLAKRGDGFHEIDTLMAKLDLHDTLVLEAIPEGIEGIAIPSGDPFVDLQAPPMDADNLALRAAAAYLAAAGWPGGVRIRLEKRIPVAAGLGGGSSDAAAVLSGLDQLYPSSLDLPALAASLGSDVPFFLLAGNAARARGRGERLEPVELPARALVLANPGIAVSAGEAYAELRGFSPRLPVAAIVADLTAGRPPRYGNALQPGVVQTYPVIREVVAALREAGLEGVVMSGSGATCFGLVPLQAGAAGLAAGLRSAHPDWWIATAATMPPKSAANPQR